MARVQPIRIVLSTVAFIAVAASLSGCSGGAGNSDTQSASPVGHRWAVENQDGLLCYDSSDDLETARGMGGDFENITPMGFQNTGDESAGGRLAQGDVISVDSVGDDYYIVTPVRAAIAAEGKPCAVDIASLHLSAKNTDSEQIADWSVGSTYTGANAIEPCFATYRLAELQYDAEVNNDGTGNGDRSLSINGGADDAARYRLKTIDPKVLTFYVVKGDQDVTINGYTAHAPHTGETIYCAHESKPQPG
jgi:hypothetical protein